MGTAVIEWSSILREFITIFVVIDPIGSIPVYMFAVRTIPEKLHHRFAIRAVLIATFVLFAFLIGGQLLLDAIGLPLGSFQIAGGLVLFLFALTMIFGESKADQEIAEAEKDDLSSAVFPLAMPSIASPGAMLGIVILTENSTNSFQEQTITAGLLLLVLSITLGLLLAANLIYKVIGNTGASVISRVMGLILATIAVDAVLNGLNRLGILEITLN